MSISQFKCLKAAHSDGLSSAVVELIASGWQPFGGVVVYNGEMCQIMIQGTPVGGGGSSGIQPGDHVTAVNHGVTVGATGVGATIGSAVYLKLDAGFAIISSASPAPNLYDGNGAAVAGASGTYMFNGGNDDIAGIQMTGTTAAVVNNEVFTLVNSLGAGTHQVNANVASGVISNNLTLGDTSAIVDDISTATVHNYGGTTIGTGTLAVALGALSNIRMPANFAGVTDGGALALPVTGSYTSHITPTVVGGAITGFVLS
jgi:hypothetical protein